MCVAMCNEQSPSVSHAHIVCVCVCVYFKYVLSHAGFISGDTG